MPRKLTLALALIGPTPALAQSAPTPPPVQAQATAPAQAPDGESMVSDDRLGRRVAPLLLLGRPDIRADLKLTTEQATSAHRAIADLYRRALATQGLAGAEALAARRSVDEAQRKWIEAELTGDQRARLDQLDLQWEGPAALVSRPAIASTLALQADQRAVLDAAVRRRDGLRQQYGPRAADDHTLTRQALTILNPEQRATWLAMLGVPFVPALAQAQPAPPTRR